MSSRRSFVSGEDLFGEVEMESFIIEILVLFFEIGFLLYIEGIDKVFMEDLVR